MSDSLHPFAAELGEEIVPEQFCQGRARDLALYLVSGADLDIVFRGCRRKTGYDVVLARLRVYPPQHPVTDIRREEDVAVIFTANDKHPVLFALRADFPRGAHTNPLPETFPVSPCIDDRPWVEAVLNWTPYVYMERVKWWFAAAADGSLTGMGQILDPLFFSAGPDLLIARDVLTHLGPERDYVLLPVRSSEAGPNALRLKGVTPEDRRLAYPFRVMVVALPPTAAGPLRSPPANLSDLASQVVTTGIDFLPHLTAWVDGCEPVARTSKLAVLLTCLVRGENDQGHERLDVRAVALDATIGAVGSALGIFQPVPGDPNAWGRLLDSARGQPANLAGVQALSMDVQLDYDLELSRACSGITDQEVVPTMLLGAGAIGSHVALALTKEGTHAISAVVDDDWLRPHNVARHILGPADIGTFKAVALARLLTEYRKAPVAPIVANVLGPDADRTAIRAAGASANTIVDATASVAVSRELANWDIGEARCFATFFNPRGDAVVVLTEAASRAVRLDALEAQYYRLLLRTSALRDHLRPVGEGLRYSTACRALSARIPETRVAALAAFAAAGISSAERTAEPSMSIWSLLPNGSMEAMTVHAAGTTQTILGDWTVMFDDDLSSELIRRRSEALPKETGGVLVGIVDTSRRVIMLVDALPPPSDSSSSSAEFVRGTEGVAGQLAAVSSTTLGMVRYIGEWHTHPPGHSAVPSAIDVEQLLVLRAELKRESLPATMLIVGHKGISVCQLSEGSE